MPRPLPPGETAPDFEAPDAHGRVWSKAALAGRPFVLFFYPKDETPGCIAEACGFRDLWKDYQALGVEVLGVSRDDAESHRRFAARGRFPYPLLSDVDGRMHRDFGALFLGLLPRRVSYLVDADGRVSHAFESNTRAADHPQAMLEAAQGLDGVSRRTSV